MGKMVHSRRQRESEYKCQISKAACPIFDGDSDDKMWLLTIVSRSDRVYFASYEIIELPAMHNSNAEVCKPMGKV